MYSSDQTGFNSSVRQCPALFIAAPASNQGKTTVTAALARYYRQQGLSVRVFKTGPDFLDPMILAQASGHPVYQLDLWMSDEMHCRALLYEAAGSADLILIEGVMGLFDGERSSADLASLFGIPVLAVIDGRAMAQTFGAIAYGLANYQKDMPFAGVFANQVASERHFAMLEESLPAGMRCYGWFGRNEKMALPERHLGLVQADEIADLEQRMDCLAAELNLLEDSLPAAVSFRIPEILNVPNPLQGLRIGIAQDAAFAFVYQANRDLLRQMGAELVEFSPLLDNELPNADALYFPGGYPELHLATLSENSAMRVSVQMFHDEGKPIVAECGGMLYLLQSLSDVNDQSAEMVGLIKGTASMQGRLSNLGMHHVVLPEGKMRGHTYHYSKVKCPLTPVSTSEGARPGRAGEPVYRLGRLNASYLHLYFPSNPEAAARLFMPTAA